MNMTETKLTTYMENYLAQEKQGYHPDGEIPGLYHRIGKKATVYCLEYYLHGKRAKRHTIGKFPRMKLEEARAEAIRIKGYADKGVDPFYGIVTSMKFYDFAKQYLMDRFGPKSEQGVTGTGYQYYAMLLNDPCEPFFDMPMNQIKTGGPGGLFPRLKEIKKSLGDSTVRKMQSNLNMLFADWTDQVLMAEENCTNPMASIKAIGKHKASTRRPTVEATISIYRATDYLSPVYGPMLKILMLNAFRKSMVTHMCWDWIDFDNNLINFPAFIMKNKAEYTHPLNAETKRILLRIERDFPFQRKRFKQVWPSTAKAPHIAGLSLAIANIVKRTGVAHFSPHDIRRVFGKYACSIVKQNPATVDALLAHKMVGVGAAHYGVEVGPDAKTLTSEIWSNWLVSQATNVDGNVTTLPVTVGHNSQNKIASI